MNNPLIFDIRHFSLDDGPGIRTTVFFKGCPLSCLWCHNPESQKIQPEMAFYEYSCIGCGHCESACPSRCIRMDVPHRIHRTQCTVCGVCADICPSNALRKIGREYTVDELVKMCVDDHHFYTSSKGGVTFSGGEPAIHIEYLHCLAQSLKQHGIHLALQTCGMFNYPEFRKNVLPFLDLIFFDVKIFNPVVHEQFTGIKNEIILKNLTLLSGEKNIQIIPRIPLVPGITDDSQNVGDIEHFLTQLGFTKWEFLEYLPGGIEKRKRLGTIDNPAMPVY